MLICHEGLGRVAAWLLFKSSNFYSGHLNSWLDSKYSQDREAMSNSLKEKAMQISQVD